MTPAWRDLAERLGMQPHPEGGWYVETWRSAAASAILFLLPAGERSHWHRVDADEVWQWSAGEPIALAIAPNGDGPVTEHRLGPAVLDGDEPQVVVPAGWWQSGRPLGAWGLVGCIVAPPFRFDGFELAPDGWEPSRGG